VDILLTNPDTINRKLININAPDEHEAFIYEPEFLVFDEVHTYDGLFGSYTATLTKRLRALRAERDCDDLQVIASSATVDNDVELFRKVSDAQSITHVDEEPRTLNPDSVSEVPNAMVATELTDTDLLAFARNERTPSLLSNVEFDVDPEKFDNERLRELLQDTLFDHFTEATDDPVVNTVQHLHRELAENPQTYDDVLEFLQSEFGLEPGEAETVLKNFQTLGTFSGLLENRTHLFSWPIDGFYGCMSCDAVYRSPRESCTKCGFDFVTRTAYCRGCDDEALIAWYCPECEQLEPYQPSDEGEQTFENDHYCQRCRHARDELIRSLRVTFHPHLECQECGYVTERSSRQECEQCGTDMVHTDTETLSCPNPECGATQPYESGCPVCQGQQRPVTGSGEVDCHNCGQTHDAGTGKVCECGTPVSQTRFLPWVCRNGDCDRTYFDQPPDSCDCGSSHTFAKAGLFEVFVDTYCEDCETSFLAERTCDCAGDFRVREGAFQRFQTFEPDGTIRSVSSFRPAAPCTHQSLRYDPDRRYDELIRGPGNVAVTTSQYLLRKVSEDEGFESAKLLSFADSHRDMKEIDRDFSEPEVGTLLDQCLLEAVRESATTWPTLDAVLDAAVERIDALHDILAPPNDIQNLTFDLRSELIGTARRHMDTEEAIRDRLRRRAIPHRYSPRYREYSGSLVSDGILDVRVVPEVHDAISKHEQAVLRGLVDAGNNAPIDEISETDGTAIDRLEERGILNVEGDYVYFNPSVVELTQAGEDDHLRYNPNNRSIEPTLNAQYGLRSESSVPFDTTIDDLAAPTHPRFTARAYRALYSETRILLSRVYHGMTDKRERRELEYLFREGNYPHFLSSGPTMELGVDIGALDALLLYGTPPNMNAYLQRIGRAGRSSNASLVHSVSQRNPIDYYYYDQPEDLMAADPQPVPLKEHNREVLRISLTWAVFDYIAANFVIPWDVERYGRYKDVSGGHTFHPRQPSPEDDAAKLTHVMSARTKALDLDTDHSQFSELATIVHDYRSDIENHLKSLLEYQFCPLCSRKYNREEAVNHCREDGCDGRIKDAGDEFGDLVKEAVDEFAERYLESYTGYIDNIDEELTSVTRQTREIKRDRRRASSDQEAQQLREEHETLIDRKSALKEQKQRVQGLSYVDFLRESRQSRYAFDMRTVAESVSVSLVDSDGDEYTTRTLGDDDGRNIQIAISELHPGAAYLDGGDTYVVSHLTTDDFESSELRKRVEDAESAELLEKYVCPGCWEAYESPDVICECGADTPPKRQRLVSPDSVTAHRSDLLFSNGAYTAREMYKKADTDVQNTYAKRETSVLSFDVEETYSIRSGTGTQLGTLEYGTFTVMVHASSYRAKYKNGAIDSERTPFEVCGDPDCSGVVYYDDDEEPYCSADSEHNPEAEEGSEFVRLGYSYETDGVRVDLGTSETSHVFAHGFRLALQFLGGVSIRDLTEVVHEASSMVDVFDAQEGGAGIAHLLVAGSDTENFDTAIRLMRDHLACDCGDGCPLCLYQYGCATRNQSDAFDREGVVDLLERTDLHLVRGNQATGTSQNNSN
jgi:ATP-dependent helicase YprA (DUF1998 family)